MNVISAVEGPDGRLFQGIFNALRQSFAEVQVYCAGGEAPDKLQNLMVAAFPEQRPDITAGALPSLAAADTENAPSGGLRLADMLASRYTGTALFATPALTDDFAPVERYTLVLLRQ